MFKKFCLWLTTNLFLVSAICLVTIGSASYLLTPNYIKKWAEKSGAFSSLADITIKRAAASQTDKGAGAGQIPYSNELVQKAAKDVLSEQFYASSTDTFIEGSFAWLRRQSPNPTFDIDLTEAKTGFINRLGELAGERYQSLPLCANNAQPKSLDLLTIDCKITDYDTELAITEQKNSLLADQTLFDKSAITSDSVGQLNGKNFFERHDEIPYIYVAIQKTPLVFGALAILSGLAVIFLAESKKKGLRKLGWRTIVAGILGIVVTTLSYFAIAAAKDLALGQKDGTTVGIYKNIVAAAMDAIRIDTAIVGISLAAASLVLGLIVIRLTRVRKNKTNIEKLESNKGELGGGQLLEEQEEEYVAELDEDMPEVSSHHRPTPPKKSGPVPSDKPLNKPATTAPTVKAQTRPRPSRPSNLIQ